MESGRIGSHNGCVRWVAAASEPSASNGQGSSTTATLNELAEKLSTLRKHLEQVIAGLNVPQEANGVVREVPRVAGSVARRLPRITGTEDSLRCHECGLTGQSGGEGWTMRLCGDDVLHAFCPDCDYRYFHRDHGEAGERIEPRDASQLK